MEVPNDLSAFFNKYKCVRNSRYEDYYKGLDTSSGLYDEELGMNNIRAEFKIDLDRLQEVVEVDLKNCTNEDILQIVLEELLWVKDSGISAVEIGILK